MAESETNPNINKDGLKGDFSTEAALLLRFDNWQKPRACDVYVVVLEAFFYHSAKVRKYLVDILSRLGARSVILQIEPLGKLLALSAAYFPIVGLTIVFI